MIRDEFNIRETCLAKNITLADLAKKMGITAVAMSQLMSRENVTTDKLKEIAAALGVQWWELIKTDAGSTGNTAIRCPHCGKPINIKLEQK